MGERDAFFELARFGERTAITASDGTLSWRGLASAVASVGVRLRNDGIASGDRVALLAAPCKDLVVATVAVQHAGAIAVPLSPLYKPFELAHVLHDSGARLVLADTNGRERLAAVADAPPIAALPCPLADAVDDTTLPPVAADDEDIALIVYTSGTTGRSKGVALTWRALGLDMRALCGSWGFSPSDVLSHALPLFHVHGLCIGIYGALLHGVAIRLHPRFDPAAIVADFADHGATVFMGVPTMYTRLLEHLDATPQHAEVLARARLFTAGSAALSTTTHARFEQLTGQRILERYGMTETLITLSNPLDGERRPGSVGLPVAGVQVRIVDDDARPVATGEPGELEVRGDSLMRGYWNDPDATAAAFRDGWFRTGDVATADADGYVRIVGRSSTDIVKSGGFKIATAELEEVLRTHPAVAEVAVIGVADATWGERVTAVVVPRGEPPTRAQLAEHCRAQLADYKTPRQLVLVDELPRNAMGKLQKSELRRAIERDHPGDADLRVHSR